jgi:hypothetical protein
MIETLSPRECVEALVAAGLDIFHGFVWIDQRTGRETRQ